MIPFQVPEAKSSKDSANPYKLQVVTPHGMSSSSSATLTNLLNMHRVSVPNVGNDFETNWARCMYDFDARKILHADNVGR